LRGELPPATTLVAERLTPTSFPVLTVSVEGRAAAGAACANVAL